MKITFLGGADEVGASSLLIEIGGRRLLIDAGIRPSPKARWGLAGDQLPHLSQINALGGLDAILVTHAHTDHTGALELVVDRYPDLPVYATAPTIALSRVLHQDSRRIMQTRLDEEGELPLFDDVAVQRLMSAFVPAPFKTRLPLGEGLAATFFPAGHIAGAAMIGLESEEGRLLISGDVSISPQRTVDGAIPPAFHPDLVILESTYGGRLHANRGVQERKLVETVAKVVAEGGKALIPAFALGRAQEILLILGEFQRRGELPIVPVWADGMVRAICQAYSSFADVLPLALQERGAQFFEGNIRPVQTQHQRNALVWQPEAVIIVASSGMLAGGPSLSYARALASSSQHAILLTGYQDEESPGRRLQEVAERGSGSIYLGKDKVDVQCLLGTYSLSAHADEGQLVSLVETLDPAHVLLVHGDEAARSSLERALSDRKRIVHLPGAGQTLEFRFDVVVPLRTRRPKGIGGDRPLDSRALWQELAAPGGGYFTPEELAKTWWGEDFEDHLAELEFELARDDLYFEKRPLGATSREGSADTYRARSLAQLEMIEHRRAQMAALPDLVGQWLILRRSDGSPYPARCLAVGRDHFTIENDEGLAQRAFPEELAAVAGTLPPTPAELEQYQPQPVAPLGMEPNQALAFANQHFPPEARLRKCGYRIEQRRLVLTFDFPDAVHERFGELIAELETTTGWKAEITPRANQAALASLARASLPQSWQTLKEPGVHYDRKLVAVTVGAPESPESEAIIAEACRSFRETSGFELSVSLAAAVSTQLPAIRTAPAGERMEINQAYAVIKAALTDKSLYRASLKGDEIVLSFISRQVGQRYQAEIESLAQQTGWPLSINPQPNQGAVMEATRAALEREGFLIQKGPSLYLERGEVSAALAGPSEAEALQRAADSILEQTGFRLAATFAEAVPASSSPTSAPAEDVVEIPIARIRLARYQQGLTLDPGKLIKAIERIQRMGLTPPVRVRRLRDGYILLDGLYRLRAAETLGIERIPCVVE